VLGANWADQTRREVPESKLFRKPRPSLILVDAGQPEEWRRRESMAESAVNRLRDCGYADCHRGHSAGLELVGCLGNGAPLGFTRIEPTASVVRCIVLMGGCGCG
jgi:hypothetical protein